MQIQLTGRNIEITEGLRTFITEKMQRIEHRFPTIMTLHVNLLVENVAQTAEGTVHMSGIDIHAAAKTDDMYTAIDELADKLMTQITKHKKKQTDHR